MGCYYHYCRNLYKNAKRFKLIGNEEDTYGQEILKIFYSIPFKINDNKSNILENIFKKYSNLKNSNNQENIIQFIDYYKTEWVPYIENGFLNYVFINK